MAFYFSPIDTPFEKGRKHYLALEQIQFPYALDITVYCTYILTDFARKFINSNLWFGGIQQEQILWSKSKFAPPTINEESKPQGGQVILLS